MIIVFLWNMLWLTTIEYPTFYCSLYALSSVGNWKFNFYDKPIEIPIYFHAQRYFPTLFFLYSNLFSYFTFPLSKTVEIKAINDVAAADMHKYVSNPLNALTILKRFTSDWQMLRQYAYNIDSTTGESFHLYYQFGIPTCRQFERTSIVNQC